jgi:CDP-paratose 2-epimerase
MIGPRRAGDGLAPPAAPVLVTGGAGFVGANLADRLAGLGVRTIVYDSLVRPGVSRNLDWLKARHPELIDARVADVRDADALGAAVREAATVYHLAAQVAVTTSLLKPADDFAVNCAATVSLLEAARRAKRPPRVVFTSTNKVYGGLSDVAVYAVGTRCEPFDPDLRDHGVGERRPLEFLSPYGCSKGAADQYVLDYGRSYGFPTTVLRMSCVYGPRQRGNADQGWVAHFLIRAMEGAAIDIFGDGRQVRDVLEVSDLVEALLAAGAPGSPLAGRAVNVGGGPRNAVSLLEMVARIGDLLGAQPTVRFGPPRPGDQRWYVSDIGRIEAETGWAPRIGVHDGLSRLHRWLAGELAEAPRPVPLAAPGAV